MLRRCDHESKGTREQHIEDLRLVLQILREHQLVIKMPKCFGAEKKPNTLVSLLAMELCERHLIKSQLLEIGHYQKLKNILSLLFNFALTMVSLSTISPIVLRHLRICVVKTYLVILFITDLKR